MSKQSKINIGQVEIVLTPNNYIALTLKKSCEDLNKLEADLIVALNDIHIPIELNDIDSNLSQHYINNTLKWGYKYVFDDFTFHLSLTNVIKDNKLKEKHLSEIKNCLEKDIPQNLVISSLHLVKQDAPEKNFESVRQYFLL